MKQKLLFFSIAILCASLGNMFAQTAFPYRLNLRDDGLAVVTSLELNVVGSRLNSTVMPYSDQEVSKLHQPELWSIDRPSLHFYSVPAQNTSNLFLYGSLALPAVFLIPKTSRKHISQIGIMYLEATSFTTGLTSIAKASFKRTRPYVFYDGTNKGPDPALITTRQTRLSFFSGHASLTASSSFFAAKVFNDIFPESKWRTPVWIAAATIPAVTGYLRVKGGKHYFTDVAAGYLVGATIGYLVPHFHKKKLSSKGSLSLSPEIDLNGTSSLRVRMVF